MTKPVDEKNLENLSGGLDNPAGRVEDRDDIRPEDDLPIAAPVQDEVSNDADGGGNTNFGR